MLIEFSKPISFCGQFSKAFKCPFFRIRDHFSASAAKVRNPPSSPKQIRLLAFFDLRLPFFRLGFLPDVGKDIVYGIILVFYEGFGPVEKDRPITGLRNGQRRAEGGLHFDVLCLDT